MNICMISREYPPETAWGGIASYTHAMASGLAAAGHTVHVIAHAPGEGQEYLDGKVIVHRIKSPVYSPEPLVPYTLIFNSMGVSRKIEELAQRIPFDIIESPDWYAESLVYGLRRTVPLVVKYHGPRFVIRQNNPVVDSQPFQWRIRESLINKLEKLAGLRADSITTPCKSLADIISQTYRIDSSRIKVIPNPVELSCQDEGGVSGLKKFVLYAGRLEKIKGAHILGEAIPLVLRELPDTRFVFCGAESREAQQNGLMQDFISTLAPARNLIFTGHCSRDELFRYYRSCALCVIPSLWETFTYTGLEAMSCAKPLVASRVGGMTDLVVHGATGLLVQPADPVALSRAIIRLLKDRTQAQLMGLAGKLRVDEKFSYDKVIAMQVAHYQNVIARLRG